MKIFSPAASVLVGGYVGMVKTVKASSFLSFPTGLTEVVQAEAFDAAALSTHQAARRAATGDFDELNGLFENAQIVIPDSFSFSEKVGWITLDLTITNLHCFGISVGDVFMSHERTSDSVVSMTVDVSQLDLTCEMNYEYKYGFLKGTGVATVPTDDNAASTTLQFTSTNLDQFPPTDSTVVGCTPSLNIVEIDFEGDFLSEVIEIAQRLLRNLLEKEVGQIACEELGSLGTTFVESMMDLATEKLAQYQQPMNSSLTDPLYLEKTLDLPPQVVPVNLKDGESSISRLARLGLDAMDVFLNTSITTTNSSNLGGESDLEINIFLRDKFLDNATRALILRADQLQLDSPILFEGHDIMTQTVITLNEARIFGLDSLTVFNPLVVIGNHTFHSNLTWDKLTVELDVTVNIKPSSLPDAILKDSVSTGITEVITIDFGVEKMDVDVSLLVILDETKLGSLQLGSLIFSSNIFPCLFRTLHTAQISGLSVAYPDKISEPTLRGFISPGLDRMVTDAVKAAFDMYSGTLRASLPSIFQTTMRNLINTKLIDVYINETASTMACPEMAARGEFLDFRLLLDKENQTYGDIPPMVKELLDDKLFSLDTASGMPRINEALVAPWTEKQSNITGVLSYPGEFFGGGSRRIQVGGLDLEIQLSASDALIENLDSMGSPLEFLIKMMNEPYALNHMAMIGAGDMPLRLSIHILFNVKDKEGTDIRNELEVAVDLASVQLILKTVMKISEASFLQFPIRDIFDWNCLVATIPAPQLGRDGLRVEGEEASVALAELVATFSRLNVNITCLECSSPGMYEWTELLSTPEAQNGTLDVASDLFDFLTDLAKGDFLQIRIDRFLADAARKCPHHKSYDPNFQPMEFQKSESAVATGTTNYGFDYLILVASVTLGLLLLLVAVMIFVRWFVRRRHRRWVGQLLPRQVRGLYQQQQKLDKREVALNANTKSMFASPEVPRLVRWSMPLIILGNVAFFLSGHLSLGATVAIEAQIAGETITVDNFYEFSMATSTLEIWNAGGEALAILILVFSVIWPYTKQIITLVLWFASPSRVSVTRRGSIFLWLDCLAKWSMVDIFVLVVSIAAFRVSIESPDSEFLPPDFYSINMLVVPMWGLYANMIAQLISQISSHYIIFYHRRIISRASNALETVNELEDDKASSVFPLEALQSLESSEGSNNKTLAIASSVRAEQSLQRRVSSNNGALANVSSVSLQSRDSSNIGALSSVSLQSRVGGNNGALANVSPQSLQYRDNNNNNSSNNNGAVTNVSRQFLQCRDVSRQSLQSRENNTNGALADVSRQSLQSRGNNNNGALANVSPVGAEQSVGGSDSSSDSSDDETFARVSPSGAEQPRGGSDKSDDESFALRNHQFTRPHREDGHKLVVRRWVTTVISVAVLLLCVLVGMGCYIGSFSLEVLGVVGVAVESGQDFENAMKYHSVFTLVQLLMEEARFLDTAGDYIGLGTLSAIFVATILVVPGIQAMVLLYQWFWSMSNKKRGRVSIVLEILQAWQYLEVYLLAVFVASWQLGPVSEFMLNEYCDNLEETFSMLVSLKILSAEDAQCFSVRSSIENGSFILAAAAALLALINTLVTKSAIQYFREKDEDERRGDDDKLSNDAFDDEADGDLSSKIRPVPVLFTDTFRWILRSAPDYDRRKLFTEKTKPLSEEWEVPANPEPQGRITDWDVPTNPEKQPTIARLESARAVDTSYSFSRFSSKALGADDNNSFHRITKSPSTAGPRALMHSESESMLTMSDMPMDSFHEEELIICASKSRWSMS